MSFFKLFLFVRHSMPVNAIICTQLLKVLEISHRQAEIQTVRHQQTIALPCLLRYPAVKYCLGLTFMYMT